MFSAAVACFGLALSLLLAAMADHVLRGAGLYKTLLIWPYAVAPAVCGALYGFLFDPTVGEVIDMLLRSLGVTWNYIQNGGQALLLVIVAACWKRQISYNFRVLPRGPAVDLPEIAASRPQVHSTAPGPAAASGA